MATKWMIILVVLPAGLLCTHYLDQVGKKLTVSCKAEDDELERINAVCQAKWKVDLEQLQPVEHGEFSNVTQNMKCYYSCYFQNYGTMNATGYFDLTRLEKSMLPYLHKGVHSCLKELKLVDPCDRAFEIYSCFIEKNYLHADPDKCNAD